MTLSQIRRIVLVILTVCLLVLGGLLAMVSSEEHAIEVPEGMVDVVAFCTNSGKADGLKKEFLDSGYSVSTSSVEYGVPVPNGFRLVIRGDKSLLDAFQAALKVRKLQSNFIDNKTALQFGGVFKTAKDAQKKAAGVQKLAGVAFQVEESTKQVKKPCVKFIIAGAPKAAANSIENSLKSSDCIDITVKDV